MELKCKKINLKSGMSEANVWELEKQEEKKTERVEIKKKNKTRK